MTPDPSDPAQAPTLSVVTPTYNRADLIAETIESVLDQQGVHLEYIVVDDGSTDDTQTVLARYQDRIRVITKPNGGEASAVNAGIEAASGRYLAIVNSDDPLLPGAMASAVNALDRDGSLSAVYPDWRRIDQQGRTIGDTTAPDYDHALLLIGHHCLPGPGAVCRTTLAQRIGARDPRWRFAGDYAFWIRLALLGPMQRLPRVLATFREHPGSISSADTGPAMAAEHIKITRAFFRDAREGTLPAPLNPALARREKEAMAWARFVASAVSGGATFDRVGHALRSAIDHPPTALSVLAKPAQNAPNTLTAAGRVLRNALARLASGPRSDERSVSP